ncbi:unnamed protein product [Dracunculus medinensis]|uniref:Trafficking protein particle complex subunit 6B n=1 Tax=Dracunculus medinensis TaxID=318479 RepID=A0A158Q2L2_DRAME|nr:unnamed protein product [Dracunculus medinensis]
MAINELQTELAERRKEWIEGLQNETHSIPSIHSEQLNLVKLCCLQSNAETRLEALGFRVGYILVEKVTKDIPRLLTELDKVKFICKEFWTAAFGKQVDNLRTNHQGVYVVQDNKFFTVANFAEGKQYLKESSIFLALPCGIIRGALSNLGIESLVTTSVEALPLVKFHVQLQKSPVP